jgi:diguanylate cyclase
MPPRRRNLHQPHTTMNLPPQPSDIAREALRRLATRRIAPTPDNYRSLYNEIAGTPGAAEVFPEKAMKALASSLPRTTPEQLKFARCFEAAVGECDWGMVSKTFRDALAELETTPRAWSRLIQDLLTQLERRHHQLTTAQKRERLEHVLTSCASDSDRLFARLQSLLGSWSETPNAGPVAPLAEAPELPEKDAVMQHTAAPAGGVPRNADLAEPLRQLAGDLLERSIAALLADTPDLSRDAAALAAQVRTAHTPSEVEACAANLTDFTARLTFHAEDRSETKAALMRVLQLLIENISELVVDDSWLHGQISMVREQISGELDVRRLDDVERRLKEAISRQSALRKELSHAKARIKSMLSGFVAHLANFNQSTGEYHDKMGDYAGKIGSANDIGELADVVDEVMRETRAIQVSVERSRQEMQTMQVRVEEADKEITRLNQELAQTSQLVRHDHLTGALNRKGLEETIDRELARAKRRNSPMCLGLIDLDNFKRLNDTYGHQTGDEALVHLAQVARRCMRPNDTLARYGGEEFVILLPDTDLEGAVAAITRLQRSLTRNFFLCENEKLLITFSAGVAQFAEGEGRDQAIARADAAMYKAKQTGKNRVIAAE